MVDIDLRVSIRFNLTRVAPRASQALSGGPPEGPPEGGCQSSTARQADTVGGDVKPDLHGFTHTAEAVVHGGPDVVEVATGALAGRSSIEDRTRATWSR